MKKKFNYFSKIKRLNKKGKILFSIIGFSVLTIIFLFGVNQQRNQNMKEVSADPWHELEIGTGVNKFKVPTDATRVRDQLDTAFSNYFHGEQGPVPILTKGHIDAFGSDAVFEEDAAGKIKNPKEPIQRTLAWYVSDVKETAGGNYFVLFKTTGTNVGGITFVALYSRNTGQTMWVQHFGNLANTTLRINTKIFAVSGDQKSFFVGANGIDKGDNFYFKYTIIGNEVDGYGNTNVKGERVDTSGSQASGIMDPKESLDVNYYNIVDQFDENDPKKPMIAGTVYFDNYPGWSSANQLKFVVPIGITDIDGWENATPQSNLNTIYQLSLDIDIPGMGGGYVPGGYGPDLDSPGTGVPKVRYGSCGPDELYRKGRYTFGLFNYQQGEDRQVDEHGHALPSYGTKLGHKKKSVHLYHDNASTQPKEHKYLLKKLYTYDNTYEQGEILILRELCTENEMYFFTREENESKLIRVRFNGTSEVTGQVIATYPKDTLINIVKHPDTSKSDKYAYFGMTGSLQPKTGAMTHDFYHPIQTPRIMQNPQGDRFFVQGVMDNSFNKESVYALGMTSDIVPKYMKQGNGRVLLFGETFKDNSIIDSNYVLYTKNPKVNHTGSLKDIPQTDILDRPPEDGVNRKNAFVGSSITDDDYPPGLHFEEAGKSIDIIMDHPSIDEAPTTPGAWSQLDRWLITGSHGGSFDSEVSLKIRDRIDEVNKPYLGRSWLEARVNRNPKALSNAIEWDKLGYNKTKRGPHIVSYFLTDSENQTTTASRKVSNITDFTVSKDKFRLDAHNFHMPLSSIYEDIETVDDFKTLAKSMAWNAENGMMDEDAAGERQVENVPLIDHTNKVEANLQQVHNLRIAKVAKPYPVDITYRPEPGIELTKRVWVFLTTKNTEPNNADNTWKQTRLTPEETNGFVYYGDDYSIPLVTAKDHTVKDVITKGNVRIYDYYATDTTDELPTIVDENKNMEGGSTPIKDGSHLYLLSINDLKRATKVGDAYQVFSFRYFGNETKYHKKYTGTIGETYGGLTITLTGEVKLNIRQVILNPQDDLVVPTEGYVMLNNANTASSRNIFNAVVNSGKLDDNPSYKSFVMTLNMKKDEVNPYSNWIWVDPIIPEFYEYAGYTTTDSNELHSIENIIPEKYRYNSEPDKEVYEKWITLYFRPHTDKPKQPYSWDYKLNEIGKIKIE